MPEKGWRLSFDNPIPLPPGRQLVTLRDVAEYITKLPKADHDTPAWQAAMEVLLLVAELHGPTMFARIGSCGAAELGRIVVARGLVLEDRRKSWVYTLARTKAGGKTGMNDDVSRFVVMHRCGASGSTQGDQKA